MTAARPKQPCRRKRLQRQPGRQRPAAVPAI